MSSRGKQALEHLQTANVLRELAKKAKDPESQRDMLAVARMYEKFAQNLQAYRAGHSAGCGEVFAGREFNA